MDTDTTRKATPEDLARKRAELDRAARRRFWTFARLVLAFAVIIGGIMLLMRDRSEGVDLSFPMTPDGERDAKYWIFRDAGGKALLEFEIPRNPAMAFSERADGRGFSAATWLGRDRDVPYLRRRR